MDKSAASTGSGAPTPGGEQRRFVAGGDAGGGASASRSRATDAAYTVEQLRLMTPEELDAIRHCRLCWEPYEVCVCREGRLRRKDEDA